MSSPAPISPASDPTSFMYVESDVPEGMTLSAWRDEKTRDERSPRRTFGVLRRRAAR